MRSGRYDIGKILKIGGGRDCAECGGSQKLECPLCNGRGTIYAYKGG